MSAMDRDELAVEYARAGSLRRLAAELGMTQWRAKSLLLQAGIELVDGRKSEGKRRSEAAQPTDADRAMWQARYDASANVADLARKLGKSTATIRYHLIRHGIQIKQTGFRSPRMVEIAKGHKHHNWKGGTYSHSNGYIYEYAPDHPAATSAKGYVLQHRLVMERHLGRYLTADELVHHINEDKEDNRIVNLELTDMSEHASHHKEHFPRDELGRFTV